MQQIQLRLLEANRIRNQIEKHFLNRSGNIHSINVVSATKVRLAFLVDLFLQSSNGSDVDLDEGKVHIHIDSRVLQ